MRETKVETHLHDAVTRAGGTTRKFSAAPRANNPDRIVIWPRRRGKAEIHFVETKAPLKTARPGQEREHERLRQLGCTVLVIDTRAKVDAYVGARPK